MTPMDTITPDDARLRAAVTERLNSHDLLGVLELGAPADEYGPEMEDFARMIRSPGTGVNQQTT